MMGTTAEQIAEKLAWQVESTSAIEVRTRDQVTNLNADPKMGPPDFLTTTEHYIETQAGQRFLEIEFLGVRDKLVKREIHYADGTRFADLNFKIEEPTVQDMIQINRQFHRESKSDFKLVPIPLRFFHVGREPLQKAVLKGQELGPSKVMGRDCEQFLFPQVRWPVPQDQVFFLDRLTGVPLKVEAYRDAEARERKSPMWVWTVESLKTTDGRHLPAKSTMVSYGSGQSRMASALSVLESVEYNKDYPASMFWPKEEPGVTVFDTVADTVRDVPKAETAEAKTSPPAVSPDSSSTTTTVMPIEAVPPTDSTPLYFFGGGLAVLLVAVFVWRRGR
jgi:hypothetical protein